MEGGGEAEVELVERVRSRDEEDKCGYTSRHKAPTEIGAVYFSVQARDYSYYYYIN